MKSHKDSFVDPCAEALGFVRFAMLHYQNFVSGVALAQDDT